MSRTTTDAAIAKTAFAEKVEGSGDYYVYLLIDPRDASPFYVGKGKGSRMFTHARERQTRRHANRDKHARINEIKAAGLEVIVAPLMRFETEAEAFCAERHLIKKAGYTALTNRSRGSAPPLPVCERPVIRLRPFDEWVSDLPALFVDAIIRRSGSLEAFYQEIAEANEAANRWKPLPGVKVRYDYVPLIVEADHD